MAVKADISEEHTERLQMRVPRAFVEAVDGWRRQQSDLPSRSEAIRRLVLVGISSSKQVLEK
jgi:metal-responsive CopG/Arc/MetJ family transcriptional regulator